MSTPTAIPIPRTRANDLFAFLDPPRIESPRWSAVETGVLALYAAVVAFGIAQHVPWADESQAWLLAHDVSLRTLLTHSLHYEGSPGLWHLFLKLLQALHLPFTAARWIAGAVATASTAVLLRYAPFPLLLRVLLPFSFFLAYQDAVVARSYTLAAIFIFPAAALLRSRRPRPLLLGLLLGLLAQISVHGALASGGLALAAIGLWRRSGSRTGTSAAAGSATGTATRTATRTGDAAWRFPAALVLLLLFWAGAIATMVPAPDIDYVAGNNVQRSLARMEQQAGLKPKGPASLAEQPMANLRPAAPIHHERHGLQSLWNRTERLLAVMTYPLSVYRGLALLLLALVVAQAWSTRRSRLPGGRVGGPAGLAGLLPHLVMILAFTSLYLAPRHVGMLFTTFVASAWLIWPDRAATEGGRRLLLLARTATAVFALVLLVQISWTFHALRKEHSEPYSPAKETALYLQQQGLGQPGSGKAAAGFYYYSIDPLLYFDRNIYFNQPPHRYWFWSTQMRHYGTVQEALARHPDFIVVGGYEGGHDAEVTRDWLPNSPPPPGVLLGDNFFIADYYRRNGYHTARVFCGHSWMRSTYAERICETVLEPDRGVR